MLADNYFFLRAQEYNRRGGSLVVDIRSKDDQYFAHIQSHKDQPAKEAWRSGRIDFKAPYQKHPVAAEKLEQILKKAATLEINFVPPLTGGFDGIEYKIWVSNGESTLHVSWWLACPHQWQGLQELYDMIMQLKDSGTRA